MNLRTLLFMLTILFFVQSCRYSKPLLSYGKRSNTRSIYDSVNDSVLNNSQPREKVERFKSISINRISFKSGYSRITTFNSSGSVIKIEKMKFFPRQVHDPGTVPREKLFSKTIEYDSLGKKATVRYFISRSVDNKLTILLDKRVRYDKNGNKILAKKVKNRTKP